MLTCPSRTSFTISHLLYDPYCLKKEAAPRGLCVSSLFVLHPGSRPSDADVLAGSAERYDIHSRKFIAAQFGYVSVVLDIATPPLAKHIIGGPSILKK